MGIVLPGKTPLVSVIFSPNLLPFSPGRNMQFTTSGCVACFDLEPETCDWLKSAMAGRASLLPWNPVGELPSARRDTSLLLGHESCSFHSCPLRNQWRSESATLVVHLL